MTERKENSKERKGNECLRKGGNKDGREMNLENVGVEEQERGGRKKDELEQCGKRNRGRARKMKRNEQKVREEGTKY